MRGPNSKCCSLLCNWTNGEYIQTRQNLNNNTENIALRNTNYFKHSSRGQLADKCSRKNTNINRIFQSSSVRLSDELWHLDWEASIIWQSGKSKNSNGFHWPVRPAKPGSLLCLFHHSIQLSVLAETVKKILLLIIWWSWSRNLIRACLQNVQYMVEAFISPSVLMCKTQH